ncbi:MAG: alpha/beta hydrolase [Burkholderiales bacterium]
MPADTGTEVDLARQDFASFDFPFVDSLPRRRAGAGELRTGLAESSAGPGPALLFLPGGYHGAWCYAGWLRHCRDTGTACAALDYRGHGALAGEGLAVDSTIEDFSEDTVQAARSFARPPILVGHSLGGLVAMLAATRMRVAGLALVAPSPPGNLPGALAIPALDESRLRPPPGHAEIVARFLGGHDGPHVAACQARLCPESARALNQRYLLSVPIDPARIAAPSLVIEAGLDRSDRHPEGQDASLARFLGGEFACIDNAPHCMMLGPVSRVALELLLAWRRGLS